MSTNIKVQRICQFCGKEFTARGIKDLQLIDGTELSTMKELVQWTLDSDKTLTF